MSVRCETCGDAFDTQEDLDAHLRMYESPCKVCGTLGEVKVQGEWVTCDRCDGAGEDPEGRQDEL